jgi:hypothetical protein
MYTTSMLQLPIKGTTLEYFFRLVPILSLLLVLAGLLLPGFRYPQVFHRYVYLFPNGGILPETVSLVPEGWHEFKVIHVRASNFCRSSGQKGIERRKRSVDAAASYGFVLLMRAWPNWMQEKRPERARPNDTKS